MNDDFVEHLFAAFGHLSRANKQARQKDAAVQQERASRRIRQEAFSEAPSSESSPVQPGQRKKGCCASKRGT